MPYNFRLDINKIEFFINTVIENTNNNLIELSKTLTNPPQVDLLYDLCVKYFLIGNFLKSRFYYNLIESEIVSKKLKVDLNLYGTDLLWENKINSISIILFYYFYLNQLLSKTVLFRIQVVSFTD